MTSIYSADNRFENRQIVLQGKVVDRWYVAGASAMASFWPTLAGAYEAADEAAIDAMIALQTNDDGTPLNPDFSPLLPQQGGEQIVPRALIDAVHWSIAFLYQHAEIGKADVLREAARLLESIRAAAVLPQVGEAKPEFKAAWQAIVSALDLVQPGWADAEGYSAQDKAVLTIKNLASTKTPKQAVDLTPDPKIHDRAMKMLCGLSFAKNADRFLISFKTKDGNVGRAEVGYGTPACAVIRQWLDERDMLVGDNTLHHLRAKYAAPATLGEAKAVAPEQDEWDRSAQNYYAGADAEISAAQFANSKIIDVQNAAAKYGEYIDAGLAYAIAEELAPVAQALPINNFENEMLDEIGLELEGIDYIGSYAEAVRVLKRRIAQLEVSQVLPVAAETQQALIDALTTCMQFINDATITDAQWAWEPVKTAQAAIALALQGEKA